MTRNEMSPGGTHRVRESYRAMRTKDGSVQLQVEEFRLTRLEKEAKGNLDLAVAKAEREVNRKLRPLATKWLATRKQVGAVRLAMQKEQAEAHLDKLQSATKQVGNHVPSLANPMLTWWYAVVGRKAAKAMLGHDAPLTPTHGGVAKASRKQSYGIVFVGDGYGVEAFAFERGVRGPVGVLRVSPERDALGGVKHAKAVLRNKLVDLPEDVDPLEAWKAIVHADMPKARGETLADDEFVLPEGTIYKVGPATGLTGDTVVEFKSKKARQEFFDDRVIVHAGGRTKVHKAAIARKPTKVGPRGLVLYGLTRPVGEQE